MRPKKRPHNLNRTSNWKASKVESTSARGGYAGKEMIHEKVSFSSHNRGRPTKVPLKFFVGLSFYIWLCVEHI